MPAWVTRQLAIALLCGIAAGAALGYFVGQSRSAAHESVGIAGPAENAISLETDDWTYGVPLDVAWRGADGAWHDDGRPACLAPGYSVQIRFWWAEVGASGTRQVVAVDCQDAATLTTPT